MKLLRRAYHFCYALWGALRFGFPSRKIHVIGITGTKGKTTTVALLAALLRAAGKKTATLSSAHLVIGEHEEKNMTGNTMPGRGFIQQFLWRAVRTKCEYAIIEATSEGVALSRHRFVRFREALVTNLEPEHIESHGSFEKYREAKAKFLRYAARQGAKIFLNQEDQGSEYFFQNIPAEQIVSYGTSMLPELSSRVYEVLPGVFGRENLASAIALARTIGISDTDIKRGVEAFRGVAGRVEYVQHEPFAVVVDYAHTPDSLEAIYSALREKMRKDRKMICVLGAAGGGRDKWKRPVMGGIAGNYCDTIILANEDPYDENPGAILDEIAAGVDEKNKQKIEKITDRREALAKAVSLARAGDTVIATGKGNEPWIHFAQGEKQPWDERKLFEEILKK